MIIWFHMISCDFLWFPMLSYSFMAINILWLKAQEFVDNANANVYVVILHDRNSGQTQTKAADGKKERMAFFSYNLHLQKATGRPKTSKDASSETPKLYKSTPKTSSSETLKTKKGSETPRVAKKSVASKLKYIDDDDEQ